MEPAHQSIKEQELLRAFPSQTARPVAGHCPGIGRHLVGRGFRQGSVSGMRAGDPMGVRLPCPEASGQFPHGVTAGAGYSAESLRVPAYSRELLCPGVPGGPFCRCPVIYGSVFLASVPVSVASEPLAARLLAAASPGAGLDFWRPDLAGGSFVPEQAHGMVPAWLAAG